jgi:hypothetical protein
MTGYPIPTQSRNHTAAQQTARKAAIARSTAVSLCGGAEDVEELFNKQLAEVTDTELSTLLSTVNSKTATKAASTPAGRLHLKGMGKAGSGVGCGKGSSAAGPANPNSFEMRALRVSHLCGCCGARWQSAAKRPMHLPCRKKEGCGVCAQTCPGCGKSAPPSESAEPPAKRPSTARSFGGM